MVEQALHLLEYRGSPRVSDPALRTDIRDALRLACIGEPTLFILGAILLVGY